MTVPPNDLWTLLLCTVRYAMGRRTYIVSDACELVRRYADLIRPEQVKQIADEVSAELRVQERCGRTLGDPIDHATWAGLVENLRWRGEP